MCVHKNCKNDGGWGGVGGVGGVGGFGWGLFALGFAGGVAVVDAVVDAGGVAVADAGEVVGLAFGGLGGAMSSGA